MRKSKEIKQIKRAAGFEYKKSKNNRKEAYVKWTQAAEMRVEQQEKKAQK